MDEIYKQNARIVYHFLYAMCKNEALAEELTQETFLRAFQRIESYDGSCKLSTWLCQIGKHLLYQTWEKQKREIPIDWNEENLFVEGRSVNDTERDVMHRIELEEVLKDLLPLYIEELCSEDSKEYVEAHIKICEECKESFSYLKYSELCVETVEKKEINAFKKLEKYISGRMMISYFLFLVVLVIGVGILLCTVPQAPVGMYYILLPVTMLATGITFHNVSVTERGSKKSGVGVMVQGILLLSSCLLVFYMIFAVRENHIPFGISVNKLGPVVDFMLRGSIILSLIILITHLYKVGRKKRKYSMWCNLTILCIFLNLMYDNFLHQMFDPETAIKYLLKNTVILFAICIVVSVVMWLIFKKNKKELNVEKRS